MESFIQYLIKSSISIAVFYMAYKYLFSKRAEFLLRRFILLSIIIYGFTGIPFSQFMLNNIVNLNRTFNIYNTGLISSAINQIDINGGTSHNIYDLWKQSLIYIYFAVSVFMFLRLASSIFILIYKYRKSEKFEKEGYIFVKLNSNKTSFSFFKYLFINERFLQNGDFNNRVVEHEKIHAKQLHSIDLLLAELLIIVQWFNPFAYLLKKAVVENNEFFTDKKTLETIPGEHDYKTLLYNNILNGERYLLTNNFSYSLIKKRIKMIKKTKSRFKLWLPLASFVLTFAFVTISLANQSSEISEKVLTNRTVINLKKSMRTDFKLEKSTKIPVNDSTVVSSVKAHKLDKDTCSLVDEMPEFPGGIEKLMEYLANNIKYPKKAKKNKVQGKVFVNFIVEKDGSISNIKILKGIGYGCNEEVIRVLKKMPKWKPGKHNGKPVRVIFNLPVKFTL